MLSSSRLQILVLGMLGALNFQTQAGNQDSGGGDIVFCMRSLPDGTQEQIALLADLYPLRHHPLFAAWNKLPANVVYEKWMTEAEKTQPDIRQKFQAAMKKLQFKSYDVFKNKQMVAPPELADDNLVIDDPACTKRQLAIQNFKKGEVLVFDPYVTRLSPAQRMLFDIHEALISIRQRAGDTTPLRRQVLNNATGENFEDLVSRSMSQPSRSYIPQPDDFVKDLSFIYYQVWRSRKLDLKTGYAEFLKQPYEALPSQAWGMIFRMALNRWSFFLDVNSNHGYWLYQESQKYNSVEAFCQALAFQLLHEYGFESRQSYRNFTDKMLPLYDREVTLFVQQELYDLALKKKPKAGKRK